MTSVEAENIGYVIGFMGESIRGSLKILNENPKENQEAIDILKKAEKLYESFLKEGL